MVIGRFMPPHAGHVYLIDFARAFCPELSVFVCTLAHEPIPGDVRHRWMCELFPTVRVVHITDEIPGAERSREGAAAIWAASIRSHLPADPAYVFASEPYGADLAAALGAAFVPVDPQRERFPVSAGAIREDPFAHWEHIPAVVRPYFVKVVAVSGAAEQAVATAEELAGRFDTIAAPRYVGMRPATAAAATPPLPPDLVVRAQLSVERALMPVANRLLVTPCHAIELARELGVGEPERLIEALAAEFPKAVPDLVVNAESDIGETVRAVADRFGRQPLP